MTKLISLSQLGAELNKIIDDERKFIEANAEKAVRIAAIKTFGKIIKMTPVGNPSLWVYKHPTKGYIDYLGWFGDAGGYVGGRARSNWMLGQTLTNDTTEDTNKTMNVAAELPVELMDKKTYFYNNLPYIEALEYGHSTQAANGMVRVSLLGWDKALDKAFKALEWHT